MVKVCVIQIDQIDWDEAVKASNTISPAEQTRLDRIERQNKDTDKLQEAWDKRWSVA